MSDDTLYVAMADPRSAEALELVQALSHELAQRYDFADDGSADFKPEDVLNPRSGFVVGQVGGRPVACGAFRPLQDDVCEIKRMFVVPGCRGRGYSKIILAELERLAAGVGYAAARLETADRLPEAIALYERAGYRRIPKFGIYLDSVRSVCFEKRLRLHDGKCFNPGREHWLASGEFVLLLRQYRASDKDIVLTLHQLATEALGLPDPTSYFADLFNIESIFLRNKGEFVIGECNGKVVAMGGLKRTSDNTAEIVRMRVHPEFQRRSYGKQILIYLERRALTLGYSTLHLDTLEVQQGAQAFYLHNGYQIVGKGSKGACLEVVYFEKPLGLT